MTSDQNSNFEAGTKAFHDPLETGNSFYDITRVIFIDSDIGTYSNIETLLLSYIHFRFFNLFLSLFFLYAHMSSCGKELPFSMLFYISEMSGTEYDNHYCIYVFGCCVGFFCYFRKYKLIHVF